MAEKRESAEATVWTIRAVARQKYPPYESARIILDGLRGGTSIAALDSKPHEGC